MPRRRSLKNQQVCRKGMFDMKDLWSGILTETAADKALQILWALVLLAAGGIIIKILLHAVRKTLAKTSLDPALHKFIINTVKIVLLIMLAITILGYLNIPTSTFVAVLGACGAAVALALKDSLANIAGGIIILINKPFGKGDYVNINGTEGIVDSIDLLVTTLKTPDNKVVSVPNGTITTSVLINYSKEEYRRVDCTFGIGYDCNIGKAKDVIYAVIESNPDIIKDIAPIVAVSSQGESAVNIDCKVWCRNSDYWNVKYYMEETVKLAFDENDIEIPYSKVDVRITK